MPCGTRSKANQVKKKVTRCNTCSKVIKEGQPKHKHQVWQRGRVKDDKYIAGKMVLKPAGTFTRTELTYICPAEEATKLLKALMEGGGAKADLPQEVVIQRTKEKCKCGCNNMKVVVTHTHEKEKVTA